MEQDIIIVIICDNKKYSDCLEKFLSQYKVCNCTDLSDFFTKKMNRNLISHFIIISTPEKEIPSIIEPFLILRYLRYKVPIIISSFLELKELKNYRYKFDDLGVRFFKSDIFLRLPFYFEDLKFKLIDSENIFYENNSDYISKNKEIIFSCLLKHPNFKGSIDCQEVNSILDTQNLLLSAIIDFEILNFIIDKPILSHKIQNKIDELKRNNHEFFEDILKIDWAELPTYLTEKHKDLLILSEYKNFIGELC